MGLDGMEVIAIGVVIGLFVVVLKQFGIWEPLSLEGKTSRERSYLLLRSIETLILLNLLVIWLGWNEIAKVMG